MDGAIVSSTTPIEDPDKVSNHRPRIKPFLKAKCWLNLPCFLGSFKRVRHIRIDLLKFITISLRLESDRVVRNVYQFLRIDICPRVALFQMRGTNIGQVVWRFSFAQVNSFMARNARNC